MTKEEALEQALAKPKDEFIRDSCILRFELAFDLGWKHLKKYLQSNKNAICLSPKECFKEAYTRGVIPYEDMWIKLADARNDAVHTYKEELAEGLYKKLPKFLKMFKELSEALKK